MLTGSRRAQLAERLERVFAEEWGRRYPGGKLSFIPGTHAWRDGYSRNFWGPLGVGRKVEW